MRLCQEYVEYFLVAQGPQKEKQQAGTRYGLKLKRFQNVRISGDTAFRATRPSMHREQVLPDVQL